MSVISHCRGAVTGTPCKDRSRRHLDGPADLKSMNGSIEVMMAKGSLTAVTEAGDVAVSFPARSHARSEATAVRRKVLARIDSAANCDVEAPPPGAMLQSALA